MLLSCVENRTLEKKKKKHSTDSIERKKGNKYIVYIENCVAKIYNIRKDR